MEALATARPSPRLRLFKLHGSVGWLRCPFKGFVDVNAVGSVVQRAFREDEVDDANTRVCGHGPSAR